MYLQAGEEDNEEGEDDDEEDVDPEGAEEEDEGDQGPVNSGVSVCIPVLLSPRSYVTYMVMLWKPCEDW